MLVSAGSTSITPRVPTPLGANGMPATPWMRINDALEANAIIVHRPDGPIVLISVDLLYVGPYLRRAVAEAIGAAVPPERLWVSASHTHRAPAVDPLRPLLGETSPTYLEFAAARVVDLVQRLLEDPGRTCSIEERSSVAHHAINRRAPGRLRLLRDGLHRGGMTIAPNRRAPVDERIRRFDLIAEDATRVAVAWHYACHPTAAPDRLAVSADFPGRVRRRLREHDPALPVLYFQGFSGDVRPPSVARFRDRPLQRTLLGPHFRDFTAAEFDAWSRSLAETVTGAAGGRAARGEAAEVVCRRLLAPSTDFFIGASSADEVTFQRLRLGELEMVGVSAEPVGRYQHLLESVAGSADILGVGCIDAVGGYFPSHEQLGQGGYEDQGFCKAFGLRSVHPDIEAHVLQRFRQLLA